MNKKKTKQNRTVSMIQYKRDLAQANKANEYLSNKLDQQYEKTEYYEQLAIQNRKNHLRQIRFNNSLTIRISDLQHVIEVLSREHSKLEGINRENWISENNTMQATEMIPLAKGYEMGEKKLEELKRKNK